METKSIKLERNEGCMQKADEVDPKYIQWEPPKKATKQNGLSKD